VKNPLRDLRFCRPSYGPPAAHYWNLESGERTEAPKLTYAPELLCPKHSRLSLPEIQELDEEMYGR
jgi:hypothetical protein